MLSMTIGKCYHITLKQLCPNILKMIVCRQTFLQHTAKVIFVANQKLTSNSRLVQGLLQWGYTRSLPNTDENVSTNVA